MCLNSNFVNNGKKKYVAHEKIGFDPHIMCEAIDISFSKL